MWYHAVATRAEDGLLMEDFLWFDRPTLDRDHERAYWQDWLVRLHVRSCSGIQGGLSPVPRLPEDVRRAKVRTYSERMQRAKEMLLHLDEPIPVF